MVEIKKTGRMNFEDFIFVIYCTGWMTTKLQYLNGIIKINRENPPWRWVELHLVEEYGDGMECYT
jgi:hypothetical protein